MRGKGEGSIYQDSRGYWTGSIELPSYTGDRRRKVIRRKVKKDLLAAMAEARTDLKLRGDLATDGLTVEQWFTQWFEQIATKQVRPNTLAGYKTVTFGHIIPAIGKVKLEKVTGKHITLVHERITDHLKLSSTYALLAHRTMAVAFKYAIRAGKIGLNPTDLVDAPRKEAPKLQALDLEESLAVLELASKDPLMGARWATALLTGARRGEVLGLEWDRVTDVLDLSWQLTRIDNSSTAGKPIVPADFEYRHLNGGLYLTRPKSYKGWRIVPLVEPLRSILEQHRLMSPPNEWGLVFTSPQQHKPIHPDRDSARWQEMLKRLGIEKPVRLHDLRHSAVDLLSLAGISDDDIMLIVGHSTRAMTQAYKSRADRDRLVKVMEKYSAIFTKPIEGTSRAIAE